MTSFSEELNILILRYLEDSGFTHTAYAFKNECLLECTIDKQSIPYAALITIIEKGLQYTKAEITVAEDVVWQGGEVDLSLLEAINPAAVEAKILEVRRLNPPILEKEAPNEDVNEEDRDPERAEIVVDDQQQIANAEEADELHLIPESAIIKLTGHTSEVFTCSFNPLNDLLATASGDSTACIWNLCDDAASNLRSPVHRLELSHNTESESVEVSNNGNIATLDWNYDGSLLATGSFDGCTRIWSSEGILVSTLRGHIGPILAIKWNKIGNYIVTAGISKTTVWNATSGLCIQQMNFHTAPVLDVSWKSNTIFASCSCDRCIHVCELYVPQPIKIFKGHTNEVNEIKWDPQGKLLASCSDDQSVKVWSMNQDTCVYDFNDAHEKEVFAIDWSPTGPGTQNPNINLILASTSYDGNVKLWNIETGICTETLSGNLQPIYSVSFSPDANFLATAGENSFLNIFSMQSGELVHRYRGSGSFFGVSWNNRSNKIAACTNDGTAYVFDLRQIR